MPDISTIPRIHIPQPFPCHFSQSINRLYRRGWAILHLMSWEKAGDMQGNLRVY